MAKKDLSNRYFVKRKESDEWNDVTTMFDGVKILSIDGFNELGEAVNVYNEQWVNSQREDFMVTTQDENGNDTIVRKNVDLKLTFICGDRYAEKATFDTQEMHDEFIAFMCNQGDVYVRSEYTRKQAHVVALESYKPTTTKLHRDKNSWIMGTITLHVLDEIEKY